MYIFLGNVNINISRKFKPAFIRSYFFTSRFFKCIKIFVYCGPNHGLNKPNYNKNLLFSGAFIIYSIFIPSLV